MIKRVNFTDRKRIPRERAVIEVQDGSPRTINASLSLDGLRLPPEAAVYLEAMCAGSNTIERFDFGVVKKIVPPSDRRLKQTEGRNVFFMLKVVDRSERIGRLVGVAEHIRPERTGTQTVAGRKGILPVEPAELGQELWRLDFSHVHDVFLLVNREMPGLDARLRHDAAMQAAIYPQIVRSILTMALLQKGDPEDDGETWPGIWLRFGMKLHPQNEKPTPMSDSDDEWSDWVEEVVQAFCDSHRFRERAEKVFAQESGGDS